MDISDNIATNYKGEKIRCILNLFYEPVDTTRNLVEHNKDWFVPLHGGHANPTFSNEWMQSHLVGDDTGDNISNLNSRLNENTSIYWVWKHYDDPVVGNPDWIGFNHYRRYFDRNKILDLMSENKGKLDMIVSASNHFQVSVLQQYAYFHFVEDMYKLESVVPKSDVGSFRRYLQQDTMYAPAYLFFMKKDDFFEWCEYAFPIMFDLLDLIDTTGRNMYNKRAICFLVERLFGFFVVKKIEQDHRIVIATPAIFDEGAKSPEIIQHELNTIQ